MSTPLSAADAADKGIDTAAALFDALKTTLDELDLTEDTYSAYQCVNDESQAFTAAFVAAFERSIKRRLQDYLKKRVGKRIG